MEVLQPKLRFSEFKGDWKTEPIGDYIELLSGIALKTAEISDDSSGTPILRGINITEGYIRHKIKIDKYYLGTTTKLEKYFVKVDDLVLGMDGSKVGKNVALITEKDQNSILIQRVARIRANKKSTIRYIYQQIFSKTFHNYVDIVNTSSGIPHISAQQIKEFKIGFPSLPEQTKIANFLSEIDEKINLLKENKSLLEEYKKGIMQKIFNRDLRFQDDNGEEFEGWEEKSLGEIAKIITGKTPSTSDTELWNGDIQFITPTDIKEGYKYQGQTARYVSGNEKMKVLPLNSIIYTCIASIGKMCISKYPSITNQQINSLVIDQLNNIEYVYYWLLYITPLIKSTQANTTLPIINKTEFSKFLIQIPSLREQTKIATFLSLIDDQIELVKTQVQDTQEYKKGLLQQMFV
jgi:type I restriction enzyme S subunit